jgi:hypothetical protein
MGGARIAAAGVAGGRWAGGRWNGNWNGGRWNGGRWWGGRWWPWAAAGVGIGLAAGWPYYGGGYYCDEYDPYCSGYGGGVYYGGGGYYGGGYVDPGYAQGDAYYQGGGGYGGGYAQRGYGGDDGAAYCARRFRTYDPQSGTYVGKGGRRIPCP